MPKLSIITINYNNLEGLKRTVESVLNQTWQEFEYIVIDGGSADGSKEYIESQNDKIDYWVSEPDLGIYNAMNKGITKASGEYLLFLNSGDHFYSNEVLKENHRSIVDYDLIYCNLEISDNDKIWIHKCPKELNFSYMFLRSLPHPATFIKAELFDRIGLYNEDYKIISDWIFFMLALFKYNCTYIGLNKVLSTFYLDGISSKVDSSEARNRVMQEHFGGFIVDYQELVLNRPIFKSNRYKMLVEIEKTLFGKKIISIFFRIYIILFSEKKLKDVLK